MQISDSSSRILAGLLEARTGQQLTMSRRWRLETALSSLLRDRGISTLDELITILVMGKEPNLSQQVVEALLNNETYFFRDRSPFDLLQRHAVPGITGVDTRRLTRHLRDAGALPGAFGTDEQAVRAAAARATTTDGIDMVAGVTTDHPYLVSVDDARFRVVAYDFGIKRTILANLLAHGCAVDVVPADTPASEVLARG